MNVFTLIVLGAALFTLLGWVAAALLWLKNADLADQVEDLTDQLRDANREIGRLKYEDARDRLERMVEATAKVVPIRSYPIGGGAIGTGKEA